MDTHSDSTDAWALAARLLVRWLEANERADTLLESVPASAGHVVRGRCQNLLYGALRHLGRIDALALPLMSRPPRPRVRAVFLLAGFELIEGGPDGHVARVVHHAVEQTKRLASPSEAGMVNAVVRKLATALATQSPPAKLANADTLAAYYSHPAWLVERWLGAFGREHTRALLEWNLQPAPVHARWRDPALPRPEWLGEPVANQDFFVIPPGHWPEVERLLAQGALFIQDPSTRHPVELLAPVPGERILDACAAPGGKALALADRLVTGRLVALDLPGARQNRLEENLARAPSGLTVHRVGCDLRTFRPATISPDLAGGFDAVLVDVPCSNTGVMRHRVDAKWRLQPADLGKHARLQLALLEAAAAVLRPGGRLVYSTCSLDSDENEDVIASFLKKNEAHFTLVKSRLSRPWTDHHDGGGAFLLHKA